MKIQYLLLSLLFFCSNSGFANPIKLDWLDLVPKAERKHFNIKGMLNQETNHIGNNPAIQPFGSGVRSDLNNKKIKIAGFAVPLEMDNKNVREFLFAPYFGACIHVPPPPLNQMIYVKTSQGFPIEALNDVVYLIGVLKTNSVNLDMFEIGYQMTAEKIENYDADFSPP